MSRQGQRSEKHRLKFDVNTLRDAIMGNVPLFEELDEIYKYKMLCGEALHITERRMFSIITRTWNPITGCTHNCSYCWARRLAAGRLKRSKRYREGFKPRLNVQELRVKFKRNEVVFVSDMGDMFCEGVPDEWIEAVLSVIAKFPQTSFLLLTKNPARYLNFEFPANVLLGATIETDRDEITAELSDAPPPSERIVAMRNLRHPHKFVSIEPVLDFTRKFADEIAAIEPEIVYIGYDNYNNKLREPQLRKVLSLINALGHYNVCLRVKTIRRAWYEERGI